MVNPCTTCCTVYGVNLTMSNTDLTLKHDNQSDIEVAVNPANANVTSARIEITRGYNRDWCVIAHDLKIKPWIARTAGYFSVRAFVSVCGVEYASNYVNFEVKFPTYQQIVGDPKVKQVMHSYWIQTLAYNTPGQTRELATYIRLNTGTDEYFAGEMLFGRLSSQSQVALYVEVPEGEDFPADPHPCADSADYYVSTFHTHPPLTYNKLVTPGMLPVVGPSEPDDHFHDRRRLPGIVYDQSPVFTPLPDLQYVLPGTPESAPAQPYQSGSYDRRETPP